MFEVDSKKESSKSLSCGFALGSIGKVINLTSNKDKFTLMVPRQMLHSWIELWKSSEYKIETILFGAFASFWVALKSSLKQQDEAGSKCFACLVVPPITIGGVSIYRNISIHFFQDRIWDKNMNMISKITLHLDV
jgi:hypothetical protein